MNDDDHALISDSGRLPVTVQRRDNGGIVINAHKAAIVLSHDEASKLAAFIAGKPYIVRYAATSPAKARFEQVDG